jgi:hypothetical protein
MFDYYGHPSRFFDGNHDWVIIGGDFLADVRGQSAVIAFQKEVANRLRRDAKICLRKAGPSGKITFDDCGLKSVVADLSMPNVRLSLQRFALYWKADCTLWVTLRSANGNCKGTYICGILWTVRDTYNFDWAFPFNVIGEPFEIHGEWKAGESGKVVFP